MGLPMKKMPHDATESRDDMAKAEPPAEDYPEIDAQAEDAGAEARWEELGHRLAPLIESLGGEMEISLTKEPIDPNRVRGKGEL